MVISPSATTAMEPACVQVSHSSADDREVVELITSGDHKAALQRLMLRHGTAVYRYCREALRDATLADDVHQQVFIQAHRDLAKFGGRSSVRTWLFAIARHRVLDAVKSRRRAADHIDAADMQAVVDPRPSAGERIDDVRLREALAECVGGLPVRVRTALLLRFQQGFTFQEMAEVCGQRAATLQAQVARALPLLRACIERRTGGSP